MAGSWEGCGMRQANDGFSSRLDTMLLSVCWNAVRLEVGRRRNACLWCSRVEGSVGLSATLLLSVRTEAFCCRVVVGCRRERLSSVRIEFGVLLAYSVTVHVVGSANGWSGWQLQPSFSARCQHAVAWSNATEADVISRQLYFRDARP